MLGGGSGSVGLVGANDSELSVPPTVDRLQFVDLQATECTEGLD